MRADAHDGGAWWGLTGDSAGWEQLHYDLSAYAGQQVEVSISYVTDFAVSGIIGVQVDDVKLTNNSVSTPLTGFEAGDLDGFTTPAAPEGSPNLRRTWVATGTIDLPGEESAGVVTTDTVILPFGLEQITDTRRSATTSSATRCAGCCGTTRTRRRPAARSRRRHDAPRGARPDACPGGPRPFGGAYRSRRAPAKSSARSRIRP